MANWFLYNTLVSVDGAVVESLSQERDMLGSIPGQDVATFNLWQANSLPVARRLRGGHDCDCVLSIAPVWRKNCTKK